jgi:hypothetical protein
MYSVFDKIIEQLTDDGNWNANIITIYQFVANFADKHLTTFIESFAHESKDL